MPVIEIQSQPLGEALAARVQASRLQERFCELARLPREQVTVIWRAAQAGHFINGNAGGLAARPEALTPVVTISAPDWHGQGVVERMLRAVVQALEEHLQVPRRAVLVMYRPLASGQVLEGDRLLEWDDA